MADEALRRLEAAHTAGDAAARDPLARAYLRTGRPAAALDLGGLEPALEEEAWAALLPRFQPVHRFPPGLGSRLVGWFGPDRRFAALEANDQAFILDAREGTRVAPREPDVSEVLAAGEPCATSEGSLFLHLFPPEGTALLVELRPDRDGTWRRIDAPRPDFREWVGEVSSDGRLVLLCGSYGQATLVTWPQLTLVAGQEFPAAARALDWDGRRACWWDPREGAILTSPLSRRLPDRLLSLAAAPEFLTLVGPVAPGSPRPLLVTPPWLLLELQGSRWSGRGLEDPSPELRGPIRLALGGDHLLAFGAPREPVRLRLGERRPLGRCDAAAGVKTGFRRREAAHWHPRAAVAALAGGVVAAGGERLVELPTGSRSLGWSPDGRSLLLAHGADIELWGPPG